ncbi:hypothetical protein E2C01_016900 [Portunus trituberculatus]|uniref:Uncharacterized protein n=1 Tax=Portunus trituberculatus TaxID=210409 RepID=A0A5B7DQA8_PORTR|nr:hypothetical protein [Portunus trituberculatus]
MNSRRGGRRDEGGGVANACMIESRRGVMRVRAAGGSGWEVGELFSLTGKRAHCFAALSECGGGVTRNGPREIIAE